MTAANTIADERTYRRALAIAGSVYFVWWFAVRAFLPEAANPFGSRLAVVATIFAMLGASYVLPAMRRRLRLAFLAGTWLITGHYYYLMVLNHGGVDWIVGCFITLIAINLGMLSLASLLAYSFFVLVLSAGLVALVPPLASSIFLPGVITIVLQAVVGMSSRLRVLRDLSESNERFRALFDSAFEGVLVHQDGRIRMVNTSLTEIVDRPEADLIGRAPMEIFAADEHDRIPQKLAQGKNFPFETVIARADGTTIDVEARGKDFEFNKQPARLVTIQRLDDRRLAEKARLAAEMASERARVRDDFISMASHELRTPLTSLGLQSELMAKESAEGKTPAPKRVHEFSDLVRRQVRRLNGLVGSMLDVSRIAAGELQLDRREIDLAALAKLIATRSSAAEEGGEGRPIAVDVPARLSVWADPLRLGQAIENLVGNARKYGEGRPIEIRVFPDGGEAVVEIRDQGLGVSPENLAKIFERFERVASPENIGGLGLGLYIARQIVEGHGGRVEAESRLGQGSVFRIRIPRIEPGESPC